MNLLGELLPRIYLIKDDKNKLQMMIDFFDDEIAPDIEDDSDDDYVNQLPEKFAQKVSSIADSLTAGFIVYLNLDTAEIEDVPEMSIKDPNEYESVTGCTFEEGNYQHPRWEKRIEFEPLPSHESFKIMERFVEQLDDTRFANELASALERRKPFANFNYLIHQSEHRQEWFDFRQKEIEEIVAEEILRHI